MTNGKAQSLREGDEPGSYTIPRIGVDGRGFTHYWHDKENVVIVYDEEGEVEAEKVLGDRSLNSWTSAVEAEYGWEQAPGDWVFVLVDAVTRAYGEEDR